MGGYMGFGMANWIYRQRPRKAFSKRESRPTCNTLPNYTRTFKLQPSKRTSRLSIVFGLMLLLVLAVALFTKVPAFMAYSDKIEHQKNDLLQRQNAEAFSFLMQAGHAKLKRGLFIEAYREFRLAKKIKSNDPTLNQFMIETLSILCENANHFCDELEDEISPGL